MGNKASHGSRGRGTGGGHPSQGPMTMTNNNSSITTPPSLPSFQGHPSSSYYTSPPTIAASREAETTTNLPPPPIMAEWAAPTIHDDSLYKIYFDMWRDGLRSLLAQVRSQMRADGVDPMPFNEVVHPLLHPFLVVKRRDHPRYYRYYHMLDMAGASREIVEETMKRDGVDPSLLETDAYGDDLVNVEQWGEAGVKKKKKGKQPEALESKTLAPAPAAAAAAATTTSSSPSKLAGKRKEQGGSGGLANQRLEDDLLTMVQAYRQLSTSSPIQVPLRGEGQSQPKEKKRTEEGWRRQYRPSSSF